MSILKCFFERCGEDRWNITAAHSFDLQPADSTDKDFYPVRDDLIAKSPQFFGTTQSLLGQSVVPIAVHFPESNTLLRLGTGFFISCTGLLVTAAHVVMTPIQERFEGITEIEDRNWTADGFQIGVLVRTNPLTQLSGYIFCTIEWAEFLAERSDSPLPFLRSDLKLNSDIAICKVRQIAPEIAHQPLPIVQTGLVGIGMGKGKTATAVGYTGLLESASDSEGDTLIEEFPLELHVARGVIEDRFHDNAIERRSLVPGPCFSVLAKYPAGMSGSPIFDDEGIYVHGVVSSGGKDADGLEKYGIGSMLAPSTRIPIRSLNGLSLLDALNSGEHGMVRLSVPDA